jgi:hypothetical protein
VHLFIFCQLFLSRIAGRCLRLPRAGPRSFPILIGPSYRTWSLTYALARYRQDQQASYWSSSTSSHHPIQTTLPVPIPILRAFSCTCRCCCCCWIPTGGCYPQSPHILSSFILLTFLCSLFQHPLPSLFLSFGCTSLNPTRASARLQTDGPRSPRACLWPFDKPTHTHPR